MTHTVGAFEAKTQFSALLHRVEKGEQIVITKHGNPVARLSPMGQKDRLGARQAIQAIKEFGKQNKLKGLDWKALRDEGRR